ncbi:hypothetical protein NPIL_241071 [Nephila pilipes]|uniref:Uncharacterized protein n=1 Tax=Nephila pilipes TaxID=299642 RepID=A0A8X6QB53_NEPPI|nr:hypothetical protein NPIL_241071 [Nephila pilipes]
MELVLGLKYMKKTRRRNGSYTLPSPNVRTPSHSIALKFDDKETRNERKIMDELTPIRKPFDHNYSVGQYVTTDELLPGFRGKYSFRQYIPSLA